MKEIVIIGGGFAGVWSGLSALRLARQLQRVDELHITLINQDAYHGLRPRFYEQDLSPTRIKLSQIFQAFPMVDCCIGTVNQIDPQQQRVHLADGQSYTYDKLILASGSAVYLPPIPGLAQYAFNVDTHLAAQRLQQHFVDVQQQQPADYTTVVIVGGGAVGIEVATELPQRLSQLFTKPANIILVDKQEIGHSLGQDVQALMPTVCAQLGITCMTNTQVQALAQDHIQLTTSRIATRTVIWAAGMRADQLCQQFALPLDDLGRLPVDQSLQIAHYTNCFGAGDVVSAPADSEHTTRLSCQHAMPLGRVAGYNAVADLFEQPRVHYQQPHFVTCVDLGSFGACYSEGWEGSLINCGDEAAAKKRYINQQRIYPPQDFSDIDAALAAAEPIFKPIPV